VIPSERYGEQFKAGRGGAAGAALLLGLVLVTLGGVIFTVARGSEFIRPYVLPGAATLAIAVLAPIAYLWRRGQCDVFSPIVLAGWTYFFPAFALSGLLLASGISSPAFLDRIPDPTRDIPRAQLFIILGYIGLVAGFALPFGRTAGFAIGRRLPRLDWDPARVMTPALVLLTFGLLLQLQAFAMGLIGYQHVAKASVLDAAVYFLSLTMTVALFVLWSAIFRAGRLDAFGKVVLALLLLIIPFMMVMTGSRAMPVMMVITIGVAFWYSRSLVRWSAVFAFGLMIASALALGIIYGTTFRETKFAAQVEKTATVMSTETESATVAENRVTVAEQWTQAIEAVNEIGRRGMTKNASFASHHLAERLDTTSSLAVIVGNHERLAPREREMGLTNNIWTATWTSFIPRFVWPGKPVISDLRKYGLLYYGVATSSPAITPMGDLLRNYGPWGVPIGMALLGFCLRLLYAALIEGSTPSIGRAAAYYLIISKVSYEALYGTLFPEMTRAAVVVALSLAFIAVILFLTKRRAAARA